MGVTPSLSTTIHSMETMSFMKYGLVANFSSTVISGRLVRFGMLDVTTSHFKPKLDKVEVDQKIKQVYPYANTSGGVGAIIIPCF